MPVSFDTIPTALLIGVLIVIVIVFIVCMDRECMCHLHPSDVERQRMQCKTIGEFEKFHKQSKCTCVHKLQISALNGFIRGFLTGFILGNFEAGIVTGLAIGAINPLMLSVEEFVC